MSALLLLLLTASPPLEVRVLEREVPVRVHLEAARITCDGKPLGTSVDAEASVRDVKVGTAKAKERPAGPATTGTWNTRSSTWSPSRSRGTR